MSDMPDLPHDRTMRLVVRTLAAVACLALVAAAASLLRPRSFDSLNYAPQQVAMLGDDGVTVVPRVDGFDGPAVSVADGVVPVVGTTCNTSDEPVEVEASIWWERMEPRGRRIQVLDDFGLVVEPGCEQQQYENEIPDQVILDRPQQWRITGAVTPTRDGGVTATWTTETFWLVP